MSMTRRRELNVSVHPVKLIASIALGIWLGFIAVLLTGMLLYKALPEAETTIVKNVATQLSTPPAAAKPVTTTHEWIETVLAETVPLVPALAATSSIETHKSERTFASPKM